MDPINREKGILEWFEKELLPEIVSQGRFGGSPDLEIENCDFEISARGTDHFASCPYFAKLVLKSRDGKLHTFHFIVKFAQQDATYRAIMDTDGQFENEATMYNDVLPGFAKFLAGTAPSTRRIVADVAPHCYFATCARGPDKAVVMLEDLRKKGFKVAESKVDLDYEHCAVALKQLARFHAVSYAMKKKDPNGFEKLKTLFMEVKYPDVPEKEEWGEAFYGVCNKRGIEYLRTKKPGLVPEDYLAKFQEKVTVKSYALMRDLVKPEEPLSVVLHGDFCRNNILFRYEGGIPVECKLFDFQTYRYATPGIDLSFFFYLNTTLAMRDRYFDRLFLDYYNTLIDTMAAILGDSRDALCSSYPLEVFQKEYAEKAVFGYVLISFFLAMMMAPPDVPVDWEVDFLTKPMCEFAADNYVQGGDVVSERIAEVVVDFYKRGYYMDTRDRSPTKATNS